MSRIKFMDTQIEHQVRRGLFAMGLRFRQGENCGLNGYKLPGRPDLVFPKFRVAVFVHGCFWHRHFCRTIRLPKTRTEFWEANIKTNRERDSRVVSEFQELGWVVEKVWECQFRGVSPVSLESLLRSLDCNSGQVI